MLIDNAKSYYFGIPCQENKKQMPLNLNSSDLEVTFLVMAEVFV